MKSIFTFLFCFILSVAYSQEKVSFGKNLKNRFVNYTEFGVLFGRGYQITPINYSYYSYPVKASANISFQTFNGVKVYKNLAAGITVGVDWYSTQQLIPISLGIRNSFGDSSNKKVKTFAGIDAGYGFYMAKYWRYRISENKRRLGFESNGWFADSNGRTSEFYAKYWL